MREEIRLLPTKMFSDRYFDRSFDIVCVIVLNILDSKQSIQLFCLFACLFGSFYPRVAALVVE